MSRPRRSSCWLALACGTIFSPLVAAETRELLVDAGPFDRQDTIVTFVLPRVPDGNTFALRDDRGRLTSLQIDDRGQATFVLRALEAGRRAVFRLEEARSSTALVAVKAERDPGGVCLLVAGLSAACYQAQGKLPRPDVPPQFLRGGYLHPLFTPSGMMVTDDYPPKHTHHHGVWSAWSRTEIQGRKPDFWNMGTKTGRTDFQSLLGSWDGPVHGGLHARHVFVDQTGPKPQTVLNEQWRVSVYATHPRKPPYFMIDLDVRQEAEDGMSLELAQYHYGGVGLRGRREWNDPKNVSFLTSEGKSRTDGDASPARWLHMGGQADGKLVGVAMLGHPGNFRHPEPLRIHPKEPFVNFAPTQPGPFTIDRAKPWVARYRFVVSDGPLNKALLDRLWNDYATPPQVQVRVARRR